MSEQTEVRVALSPLGEAHARAEKTAVEELAGRIGYGRTMHLCEELWGESLKRAGCPAGGTLSVYCCVASLVPCPGRAHKSAGQDHCDWCCGSHRVTQKVAWAISRLEPQT